MLMKLTVGADFTNIWAQLFGANRVTLFGARRLANSEEILANGD